MRILLIRLMPALVAALLLLAAGRAQAREWPQIIHCVFGGPFDHCG